ncbi:hypothetical protein PANT_5c00102 [Moesziomyces antarcticus T-34]|uniref:Uncharacterized protein n=1 Tax=Pseudozyma antarctica (strain T-34) TaxID=1151754 RepID=M9LTB5_PSEA3|nr:hypothetical protein PANT_5c00102 [Moesziomyces antarcticus T-34]
MKHTSIRPSYHFGPLPKSEPPSPSSGAARVASDEPATDSQVESYFFTTVQRLKPALFRNPSNTAAKPAELLLTRPGLSICLTVAQELDSWLHRRLDLADVTFPLRPLALGLWKTTSPHRRFKPAIRIDFGIFQRPSKSRVPTLVSDPTRLSSPVLSSEDISSVTMTRDSKAALRQSGRRRAAGVVAMLAVATAVTTATFADASTLPSNLWGKRQDPSMLSQVEAQVLKLISADGSFATMTGANANAIQSAVGMSGDVTPAVVSALSSATAASAAATDAASTAQTPSAIVQAVEATAAPTDKVASDTLSSAQESQLEGEVGAVAGDSTADGGVQSWTYDPGAFGCLGSDASGDAAATLCSVNAPAPAATGARSEQALDSVGESAFEPVNAAPTPMRRNAVRAAPTPEPRLDGDLSRRQYPIDPAGPAYTSLLVSSNLFPLFTSYVTLEPPSTTRVNFGPTSNLNVSSIPRRGSSDSGNGEAPGNINNPNSPDLGWLDVQIGGVPYKNGDLIASIVWILATIALIPLLLIRLLRRSSLISMVLITIIVFMVLMLIGFGVRAKLANNTPTTSMMNVEGIILAVLLPLLLEPLLHLLGLYSKQGGRPSGVPTASLVLRILNFIVFLLFLVAAAYYASWLDKWENALKMTQTAQDLPDIIPPKVTRIAPVVGAIIEIIVILGAALLIPVARGDAGSMRPGGFIFILLILLFVATVYRLLQALHATTRISAEQGGSLDANDLLPFFQGGSSNTTTDNQRVANGLSLAPQGMYGPNSEGIDWEQLQLTMASRGTPQTPLIFNLVYVLPMWLMVFLLFFTHAPAAKKTEEAAGGEGNVAVAKA